MAVLDDLTTAYANVVANLSAMTTSPKPSYTIDGETYQWAELFQIYTNQAKVLREEIQAAGSPFEIRTAALS